MAFRLSREDALILKDVSDFARKGRIRLFIVGGYLRDIACERLRSDPDIDFALKRGAIKFGRALAAKLKAGFVVLDREHGCCRLVKKSRDKLYTLDFADFRGKDIVDDLLHRDFTINSQAIRLEDFLSLARAGRQFSSDRLSEFIIDPYGSAVDIRKGIIRLVNKDGFVEDPLRILRAFSLAAIFKFKIEDKTLKLARLKRKRLKGVSSERIRDELFKILDCKDAYSYISGLDKLGILTVVLPEIELMRGVKQGPYHHLDVWRHSLETLRQLEALLNEVKNNKDISGYLDEEISSGRRRRALIKFGAILHDIGKPQAKRRLGKKTIFHGHERVGLGITREVCLRMKLSNDETDSLGKMVFWHLRPGYLADNEVVSSRASYRYFRDAGKEALSILLISIADQRSTRGRLTSRSSRMQHERVVFGLIKGYLKKQKEKELPRLINGDDLIRKFRLEPSPLIGKILADIDELQAIGRIKSKKEALCAAGKMLR